MLGEGELQTGVPQPGERMSSMMCPLVVLDSTGRLELAIGSSGASRIRTALVHTLANILVDGQRTGPAIAAPRFHPVIFDGLPVIHCEPGRPVGDLDALSDAGFAVNMWTEADAYFGGVSAVGDAGAGADPRRGGVGLLA
jgi:gamma-glutamyltranspeptidase / glutathione hydrolase